MLYLIPSVWKVPLNLGVKTLNRNGAIVVIGLFGQEVRMPLFETVIKEYQMYGSLWGNYNELREVIELAKEGRLKHRIQKFVCPVSMMPLNYCATVI